MNEVKELECVALIQLKRQLDIEIKQCSRFKKGNITPANLWCLAVSALLIL